MTDVVEYETSVKRALIPLCNPLLSQSVPTCVEHGGGQRRRGGLVQEQFTHDHPRGVPGERPLQEAHPEEVEVPVEAEGDEGHIPRVSPVNTLLFPCEQLMHKVSSGEQASVQGHVGHPWETSHLSHQSVYHILGWRRW